MSETRLPITVRLPVNALSLRRLSVVAPLLRTFRLPLMEPAKSRAVPLAIVRSTAAPVALFVTIPPAPGKAERLRKSPRI